MGGRVITGAGCLRKQITVTIHTVNEKVVVPADEIKT